ncbi:DNA polymerase IV [Nocardia sp. SYP-A9097]|uniref:DNA polymerase IV n=1 Tax=Nocardia sp. SYP-A9097 TaxID=2663237 RepID=UPI001329CD0D|nr:DNA polymerase IV [Nocardia sp. SYP-A9097]MRH86372.1 DNA polymerase IV [Nocardia sp. SYP-A9097]
MTRWLLHVDLDQFQAAVEFRRHPELRGQPVIVGGSGDPAEPRKVVSCASYPARAHGVRAGMPLKSALRLCPDGVFLAQDLATYAEASEEIMALLRTFPGRVEVLGFDEAFLAVDTDDPEQLAREIRAAIAELGLTCAVGIGDNKLRAKLATGFAKAVGKTGDSDTIRDGGTGIFRLTADNWTELMAHRPATALWGIGARIAKRMSAMGIETIADLAAADQELLAKEFGPNTGPYFWVLGHGVGDTDIAEPREPVGHSRSETFPTDLTELAEFDAAITELATQVAEETFAGGRSVGRVGVTVRTKTFFTRTKQRKLPQPTTDVDEVVRTALRVLHNFELDRPIRLLGVRVEFGA